MADDQRLKTNEATGQVLPPCGTNRQLRFFSFPRFPFHFDVQALDFLV
jgi:hypothetical protein